MHLNLGGHWAALGRLCCRGPNWLSFPRQVRLQWPRDRTGRVACKRTSRAATSTSPSGRRTAGRCARCRISTSTSAKASSSRSSAPPAAARAPSSMSLLGLIKPDSGDIRHGRQAARGARHRPRHGVPGVRAAALAHGAGTTSSWASNSRAWRRDARRAVSQPLIEMIGLAGFEGHYPARAVRRHEAARRPRPRARHRSRTCC